MKVNVSMNGFRRNLSESVKGLRDIVQNVIDGEHYDNEGLIDAMNEVICSSNSLNCIFQEGVKDFSDLSNISIELIDEDE